LKRGANNWLSLRNIYGKIEHIEEDWLTPAEYLPYIDALLGEIDLDPCSNHDANLQGLQAKKIYTLKEDGLNIETPWTGVTYLFPPTYGRCTWSIKRGTWRWSKRGGKVSKAPSVIWFRRLVKEWKLRNIPEALFYTTYPEMLRICPEVWDFPMCFPTDRPNLIHGKKYFTNKNPMHWGYFVYLPRLSLGFKQTERFEEVFSELGRVIC
jgi:hypothetical protein|tara:strand:+ start:5183 stop:5809 length:627 start_codon:yes stop_codon:yes gene_type:complete